VINPAQSFSHENNAPFVTFYADLCRRAEAAILHNCFQQVLIDKWGNGVKCGNYGHFTTDGVADTFGWMQDRPWLSSVVPSNAENNLANWLTTETSNRWSIQKNKGGSRLYLAGTTSTPNPRRLFDFVTVSTGTTDTPVAYPVTGGELDGYYPFPGHRKANLYHPSALYPETGVETTTRLHRHTAESILNTVATGTRNPTRELSPWMMMPLATNYDNQVEDEFVERKYARNLLAMFRGKNIKEGLFFTKWFLPVPSDPTYQSRFEKLTEAWGQTQRTVTEVYSTRVRKYTRTWSQGTLPSNYGDGSDTAAEKAARLEFTLRDSTGAEREVRLNSRPIIRNSGDNQTTTVHQTVLTVDFDWVDQTYIEDALQYEINLECSMEFTGAIASHVADVHDFGTVQLFVSDGMGGGYYTQAYDRCEGNAAYIYTMNAPKSSDNRYRMRLQLGCTNFAGTVFADTVAPFALTTRVQLLHESPLPFVSRYNLLQLIPTREETPILEGMQAARSDMNHDGIVDELDLTVYLDEWFSEGAAADFDVDSSVTAEDADAFIQAYSEGT
jgi:hypothetical protein